MYEVSDELGIPYEHVERINSAWWRFVTEILARPEMVAVRMTYLITIKPSVTKLRRYCEKISALIEMLYQQMHVGVEDRRYDSLKKMESHLKVLQGSYFRLLEERKTARRLRNGRESVGPFTGVGLEKRRFIATRMHEARALRALEKNGTT